MLKQDKILIVRYGTIGDTIFASAFLRELRKTQQNSVIDILIDEDYAEIVENCPYINNIKYTKSKHRDMFIFYYINLFRQYDTIYFLKNDKFLSRCAFFAGVKNRIGFDVKRNFGFTVKVPYEDKKHEIDYYLDLLKATGIPVTNAKTELWLNDSTSDSVVKILENIYTKKVLIHATSRFSQKNWNSEKWNEVIYKLINDYKCTVFLAGAEKDKDIYDEILVSDRSIDNTKIVNLCGKMRVKEIIELVNNIDLVIGIDSGIIHIAAALAKPSVLLHGPTSLIRWAPRSDKCRIVTNNDDCTSCLFERRKNLCKNMKIAKCMDKITVEDVMKAIVEI